MDNMEKKINWSLVSSVLFGLVLSLMGYIVNQNERRLTILESWREDHEKYSREQIVEISSRLATIEAKLDQALKAIEK